MNEIGVGGIESDGSHVHGNLAPMVSRMHDHMEQNVLLLAGEAFAFRVLVSSRIGEARLAERSQIVLPACMKLIDF